MALARITLWTGYAISLIAGLMIVCGLLSLGFLDGNSAAAFLISGAANGLLGAIIILTLRGGSEGERTKDTIYFLLLFWTLLPLVAGIPFFFAGLTATWSQTYFEGVSAFTTTGASSLIAEYVPYSFRIYRSALEWMGGGAMAVIAVVVLAALNLSGTGVHRSMLFTLPKGDLFSRFIAVGRPVLIVYGTLTSMLFLSLVISGTDIADALCLSLSGTATGGMTPRTDPLSAYVSPVGMTVLTVIVFLGASNIAVLWDIFRLRNVSSIRTYLRNGEFHGMLYAIAMLSFLGIIFAGAGRVFPILSEAVLLVSTSGMNVSADALERVPPTILISVALIGGSALSTAGGLKMIRVILLLRHAGTDFERLSHPSRIRAVHFKGQRLEDHAFISVWMYFLAYTFAFAAGIGLLALAGSGFEEAVYLSAASLSNTGPMAAMATNADIFYDMHLSQYWVLSLIMIIGRVEVLAILAAIAPSVWKR